MTTPDIFGHADRSLMILFNYMSREFQNFAILPFDRLNILDVRERVNAMYKRMNNVIVREYNDQPSNFRYTKTLEEVMCEHHIPGLWGIDTRMLTRKLRDCGSIRGVLTSIETSTPNIFVKISRFVLSAQSSTVS